MHQKRTFPGPVESGLGYAASSQPLLLATPQGVASKRVNLPFVDVQRVSSPFPGKPAAITVKPTLAIGLRIPISKLPRTTVQTFLDVNICI